MITSKSLSLAIFLALSSVVGSAGCYVDADYPLEAEGWQPQYYDGYVVYYDDVGRPFYYVNGAAVWIPAASPLYARYYGYWRAHPHAYSHWSAHYGARYHGYHHRRR